MSPEETIKWKHSAWVIIVKNINQDNLETEKD